MCLMFSDRSMYMQITTKQFKEDYPKITVYRFLNNSKINLERSTTILSERMVNGFILPLRNRSNRKDWLAIICTDMELDEKEIIRIYGKRWDIEVFFKTCKQMLKLESECKSLSYDALTAHVSIVFTRYMVLSVEKRLNEDDRTVGERFFIMVDELQDITFNQSMAIIVQAFIDSVQEFLHLTDDQINSLLASFVSHLPAYLRDSLHIAQAA